MVRKVSRGRLLHVYRTSDFPARVESIEKSPKKGMVRVVLEVPEADEQRVREMGNDWAELTPTFAKIRDKRTQ